MRQNHLVHSSGLLIPSPPHTCTCSLGIFFPHISKLFLPAVVFRLLQVAVSSRRILLQIQPAIFHAVRRSQPARLGDQTDYQEGHAAPLLSPAAVAAVVGVFTLSIVHSHSSRSPDQPHNRLAVLPPPPSCCLPIRSCTCTQFSYHKVKLHSLELC